MSGYLYIYIYIHTYVYVTIFEKMGHLTKNLEIPGFFCFLIA